MIIGYDRKVNDVISLGSDTRRYSVGATFLHQFHARGCIFIVVHVAWLPQYGHCPPNGFASFLGAGRCLSPGQTPALQLLSPGAGT